MDFNINKIYHKYVIKLVLFTLILFKSKIRNPLEYKTLVISFVKKRIPWEIDLKIDTGVKLARDDERELFLGELLDGVETDYLKSVTVSFKTPLRETVIIVDLGNYELYQNFLYS